MKILIIEQDFEIKQGQVPGGLFEIGRRLVARGDKVTVIAGNSLLKLPLERKKIALLQKEAVAVIVLNILYNGKIKFIKKCAAYFSFAWQASIQGQRLPRPDLVMALSPPLPAAYAALLLSRRYRAPLILFINELWPEVLIKRGDLGNKVLILLFRRMEEKIYRGAAKIIAATAEIAEIIAGMKFALPDRQIQSLELSIPEDDYADRLQELIAGLLGEPGQEKPELIM